ncbi:MAG TPA: HAMP domain-containing sensor histidine kinase [Dehalococcoidia bacterium]
MTGAQAFFQGLQGRLTLAFVGLTLAALALAGAAFVLLTRDEQRQHALDRAAAASPAIHLDFTRLLVQGASLAELEAYAEDAADRNDVRLLILDSTDRVVLDTAGELTGQVVDAPDDVAWASGIQPATTPTWKLSSGQPGSGLIFFKGTGPLVVTGNGGGTVPAATLSPYQLQVAISEQVVSRAWLGLLPGLAAAAAAALPLAVGMAVVMARHITRPLEQLTAATHRMAGGVFEVEVPAQRRDEVGQLARAFAAMATRVGEAQAQVRALVAGVSHDLRTPLNSILGFAHALRTGVAEEEGAIRRAGDVIYDEATRMAARLADLLYLSELESGQVVIRPEPVDLGALAASVTARMAPGAAARGVRFAADLPPGVTVRADGDKLERVLENLLDNARKFTPPGETCRVTVRLRDGWARFTTANPAPDMDPEEVPRLLERFYRRDRARTGRSAGSGLGLPIAGDLVRLHGGRLEARLTRGTFTVAVSLPATEAAGGPDGASPDLPEPARPRGLPAPLARRSAGPAGGARSEAPPSSGNGRAG